MSQDTTPPARVSATIYAGATFRKGWARVMYPYPTQLVAGVVCKLDGTPAPDSDRQLDDYTDCTAIAELRDATSNDLLATFSSAAGATGSIAATGNRLELYLSDTATGALTPFESATCQVELRRPWGDVERLYQIDFSYSAQTTAVQPPAP